MTGFDPAAAELQGQVNDLRSELANAERSEQWAIRSLAKVAQALEEALGQDWAEHGEGNLADGVTLLARQREMAKRGGAVKALRVEAARGLEAAEKAAERDSPFTDFAVHLMRGLAGELVRRSDAIESGEVTLP